MENIKADKVLNKYLYDINIIDEIYITLNKSKIEINGLNYNQYTVDCVDMENSKYYMAVYNINGKTVITIIEDGEINHSQFLITSDDVFEYIKKEDLTKYVGYNIARMVYAYFDY